MQTKFVLDEVPDVFIPLQLLASLCLLFVLPSRPTLEWHTPEPETRGKADKKMASSRAWSDGAGCCYSMET
jgi:hypothetical protein